MKIKIKEALNESLKFLKEMTKKEELVVSERSAIDLHCIRVGKQELVKYPHAIFLDLYVSNDNREEKVGEIISEVYTSMVSIDKDMVVKCIKQENDGLEFVAGNDNKHLEVYIGIKNKDAEREEVEIIEGVPVYKLEKCISEFIHDFILEVCDYGEVDNLYTNDIQRLVKLSEGYSLSEIIKTMNRLDLQFSEVELDNSVLDTENIWECNVCKFAEYIVTKTVEDDKVWKCINQETEEYDWVDR